MSNRTRGTWTKALAEKGITAQLVAGSNPENIIAVVISGYKFDKTTHMTKSSILDLVNDITCMGVKDAYTQYVNDRQSVALQKINTAHGRTAIEILENQLGQARTYADTFHNYQFKGKALHDCLALYIYDTENNHELITDKHENFAYYKTWVKMVYGFYMDKDNKDWKHGKTIAENVMRWSLKTKQVRLIREHVYSNEALCEFVRCWEKANNLRLPMSRQEYVNKFIDSINQEVGIG